MKKYSFSSILNIILIVIMLSGIIVYIYDINYPSQVSPASKVKTEQVVANTKQLLPWEPLLIASTSILLFFLKYFLVDKPKEKKVHEIHNEKHSLFVSALNMNYAELPSIRLSSEGRSIMYRDMVKAEVDTVASLAMEFVESNHTFTSPTDFKQKIFKLLIRITEDTEKTWKLDGVPKLVIDTYRDIEYDRLQILKSSVEDIALYAEDNWGAGVREFLNSLNTHIQLFITEDTIEVFNRLNGKLNGVKYKEVYL